MFMAIERCHRWPKQCTLARSCFLANGGAEAFSELGYRILAITSMVYRIWGKVRLRQLQAWVDTWACPQLFGGPKERSPDTAAWLLALELEHAPAHSVHVSAQATDIYKCFDQLPRETISYWERARGGQLASSRHG